MMRFEWDPAKARSNQGKHHVSFDDAMLVFEDPYALFDRTAPAQRGSCAGRRSAWLEGSYCCWWSTPRGKHAGTK